MVSLPQVWIDIERIDKCFGCGPNNPIGLKLKFEWDGKTARAEFTPGEVYQGWAGIVHGGILSVMLDEAMAYAAFFEGLPSVTAEAKVKLKLPAKVGEPLVISASVTKKTRRLIESTATICLKDGTLVAEGSATQIVIRNGPWKDKLNGSGSDAANQK
ncbi:MAG: PaaI family thioesterase [Chloroflexi bacterium]|nr:PaaI family thioesterase [Chloroflexota bacterium]